MKSENRTAFEKDSNCELAELFLKVRDYIKVCIGNDVKEKHNKNTTSFFTKEGGYCSIRVKDDYICIIWFKGTTIEDKYKLLTGKGKYARNQKIYNLNSKTREILRYYIQETFIKLIEYNELSKIKSSIIS
jgi:hypothetical protein